MRLASARYSLTTEDSCLSRNLEANVSPSTLLRKRTQ